MAKHRLKAPRQEKFRVIDQDDIEEIIEDYREYKSQQQVADIWGVSQSTIQRAIAKFVFDTRKLAFQNKPWCQEAGKFRRAILG